MMSLDSAALKAVSGVSTLAVCGASAVLVLNDPKPATAPLRPPVGAGSTTQTATLVIPPSCARVVLGGRPQMAPAQLSAAAQQALQQIQKAQGNRAAQRMILSQLSAADRQALTAYLNQHSPGSGAATGCSGSGTGGTGTGSGDIVASVGNGGAPVTPVTNTYVS